MTLGSSSVWHLMKCASRQSYDRRTDGQCFYSIGIELGAFVKVMD
jgi:hypothetical protein